MDISDLIIDNNLVNVPLKTHPSSLNFSPAGKKIPAQKN